MTPLTKERIAEIPEQFQGMVESFNFCRKEGIYLTERDLLFEEALVLAADARIEARRLAAEMDRRTVDGNKAMIKAINTIDGMGVLLNRYKVALDPLTAEGENMPEACERMVAEHAALLRFAGEMDRIARLGLDDEMADNIMSAAVRHGLMQTVEGDDPQVTPLGQSALDAAKRAEGETK